MKKVEGPSTGGMASWVTRQKPNRPVKPGKPKPGDKKKPLPVPPRTTKPPIQKPGGAPGTKPLPAPRPIGRRGKPSPVPGIVSGGPKPRLYGFRSKKFPGVM